VKILWTSSLSSSLRASHRFILFLFSVLAATAAQAQSGPGDLLVAPTRVVLEGRQRTAEITLVNIGPAAATYRISLVNLRMDKQGGTKQIEISGAEPGERFANDLIRFSPRQVTLEPHAAQTVRLQVRKPAELEPGEYRSHLLFRAIPAGTPAATDTEPSTALSVHLSIIYGVSIPVIVRQGETSAEATLSALELVPPAGAEKESTLRFQINRTGNRSVYGDLAVTFVPAGGKPRVVGLAKGIAVYTPNPERIAGIGLQTLPGVVLKNGLLRLVYTKQDKGQGRLAEAELRLP
jgi:P pilus assembly chaperone PapD